MEFAIFVAVFIGLFLVGMPVGFAMISSSVVWALLKDVNLAFFAMEMFSSLDSFTLIAIPMFMLTAEVMNTSSVADRMFGFCNNLVGWIPGGLGHTNVLTSVVFAGMSGSAGADAGGNYVIAYENGVLTVKDPPILVEVDMSGINVQDKIFDGQPLEIMLTLAAAGLDQCNARVVGENFA